jgi:DNA-binding CsgD family transcriptional regulator
MLSLARRGAHEIEQRLLDDKGIAERVLLQHFLQRRRGAKGPLVLVTERRLITNGAAAQLVSPDDAPVLWEQAKRALANERTDGSPVALTGGAAVKLTCEPVFDGTTLLGALVHLRPDDTDVASVGQRARRNDAGLASLTATEASVAGLATEGLTNRDIGERLFMSRHTVDSHLRSIYRKLGVNSRLALTRAVMEMSDIP